MLLLESCHGFHVEGRYFRSCGMNHILVHMSALPGSASRYRQYFLISAGNLVGVGTYFQILVSRCCLVLWGSWLKFGNEK